MLGSDACTGITDSDDDRGVFVCRDQLHPAASWRVTQRVRGEILERLLEPHRIAGDYLGAGRDVGGNFYALLSGRPAVARHHAPEQIFERNVLRLERLGAAFE